MPLGGSGFEIEALMAGSVIANGPEKRETISL